MKKKKATPELEDFGGKYKKSKINDYFVNKYFNSVKKLLDYVPFHEGFRVLEVGCGEGHSTKRLRGLLPEGSIIEASEYVEKQIPLAKKLNPGIRIIQEDIYNLKRKNKSFNLIFVLEVLEHLEDPKKALNELHRVTNDYLVAGVPREPIWRVMNMLRGKYWMSLGNTPGHLNHWSSNGIIRFIESGGFKLIKVEKPLPWTIGLFKKYK